MGRMAAGVQIIGRNMLTRKRVVPFVFGLILVFLFLWIGSVLPRTTTEVFASPDETAVSIFAKSWRWGYGFRIPTGVPASLQDVPGLHPRSMVQQGNELVPVGFLGMFLLMVDAERLLTGFGPFLTLFIVLSSAWPLFRLTERMSRRVATVATLIYLFFPTVLLYTNRGLFPNLPVVALGLWSVHLLSDKRGGLRAAFGGAALGIALMIRPVEAVWLLPWIVWAIWKQTRLNKIICAVPVVFICVSAYLVSVQTYGSWIPTIGYWLRDVVASPATTSIASPSPVSSLTVLPFGIHPRAIWSNVRDYLFGILGLWIAASCLGIVLFIRRGWSRTHTQLAILGGWTICVLLLFYGQAMYADNIRGNASIGNSFLRYMLPVVPMIAIGIGLLVNKLWDSGKRARLLGIFLAAFFVIFGISTAVARDEEGLFQTQKELQRYLRIRQTAEQVLQPGTIIMSDRSDKIFAGTSFVAVSPMLPLETVDRIFLKKVPLAIFARRVNIENEDWDEVFLSKMAQFNGGEALYLYKQ